VICRLGWPEIRGKERREEEYKIKTSRVAVSDMLNETAWQQRQWDREKQNNFPWRVTGKSKFTLTLYYYRQRAQSCARAALVFVRAPKKRLARTSSNKFWWCANKRADIYLLLNTRCKRDVECAVNNSAASNSAQGRTELKKQWQINSPEICILSH